MNDIIDPEDFFQQLTLQAFKKMIFHQLKKSHRTYKTKTSYHE